MAAVKGKQRVIIGNSHAALSALESINRIDPQSNTIIIGKDEEMAYSPASLIAFIAGEIKEENLSLRSSSFYDMMNTRLLARHRVEDLDARNKEITFTDGSKLGYDQVLVAAGAIPVVPQLEGLKKEEAITLRSLNDARRIIELCRGARKVVILGAGLIGMEIATALRKKGLDVVLVEMAERVVPLYFDDDGASLIQSAYREQGIEVITGNKVTGIERGVNEQRVNLQSGDKLEADFVLVATGAKPNVEFMVNSGIKIIDGVLVNERMQTSDPSVFAAGDVAQGKGFFGEDNIMAPSVFNAVYQGEVAGDNMAGGARVFAGSLAMNIFNAFGDVFFSMGVSLAENEGKGLKVLKVVDKTKRSLKKLVISEGKLVGCTMINQPVDAGLCREMIIKRWPADDVIEHFENDLASAFRRTLIKENSEEMKLQRGGGVYKAHW